METIPYHLEFTRAGRKFQFLRAFIVLLVGAGLFYLVATGRVNASDTLDNILRIVGGFIAVSGVIALVFLIVATARNTRQVIDANDNGLTVQREGKDTQTFKWEDVTEYTVEEGAGVVSLDTFLPTNRTSYSRGDAGDDLFGCAFGLTLGLYFLLLEAFIGGWTRKIRFRLKSRRRLTVSGSGEAMDAFIDRVLPHYLPDKLKKPGAEPEAEKKSTRSRKKKQVDDAPQD